MLEQEIEAAAREILEYLSAHGDAPVLALKEALGKPELYFYMGLGNLILRHRVGIQERQGAFWAIRIPDMAKAA
jgi:hypothetical protein